MVIFATKDQSLSNAHTNGNRRRLTDATFNPTPSPRTYNPTPVRLHPTVAPTEEPTEEPKSLRKATASSASLTHNPTLSPKTHNPTPSRYHPTISPTEEPTEEISSTDNIDQERSVSETASRGARGSIRGSTPDFDTSRSAAVDLTSSSSPPGSSSSASLSSVANPNILMNPTDGGVITSTIVTSIIDDEILGAGPNSVDSSVVVSSTPNSLETATFDVDKVFYGLDDLDSMLDAALASAALIEAAASK